MNTRIVDVVLAVTGFEEMTAAHAGRFQIQVVVALAGHSIVEVDLSRTVAMDCAGLGALIAIRNQARRQHATVRLVGVQPAIRRLLVVVRAEELFEFASFRTPGIFPADKIVTPDFSQPLPGTTSPGALSSWSAAA